MEEKRRFRDASVPCIWTVAHNGSPATSKTSLLSGLAVHLAKQGFDVTAVDLIPKALELGAALARAECVHVSFVEADLLTWEAPTPFDLVFDSGCLHSLISGSPRLYKKRLLDWLAPSGDYVLGHWGKRHQLDWRPIGPRRRSRRALVELFAPELVEHAHHEELMRDVPMPFGPTVLGVGLWMKRAHCPTQ